MPPGPAGGVGGLGWDQKPPPHCYPAGSPWLTPRSHLSPEGPSGPWDQLDGHQSQPPPPSTKLWAQDTSVSVEVQPKVGTVPPQLHGSVPTSPRLALCPCSLVLPAALSTLWPPWAGEACPAPWVRQSRLWLFRCTSHPYPYHSHKTPQPAQPPRTEVCQDPGTCRHDSRLYLCPPLSQHLCDPGSATPWLHGGRYLLRVAGRDLLEALACLPEVNVFGAELLLEELLRSRESCWPGRHRGCGMAICQQRMGAGTKVWAVALTVK